MGAETARPGVGLRITALEVGRVLGLHKPALTYMRHWGEEQDVPLIMFVIEGGESPILVDTGGDLERADEHHGFRMVQKPAQRPDEAVRLIGLDPADIRTVVNTHLHWDHSSHNHLFPNAEVLVQQLELDYALNPVQWHCRTFEVLPGVNPAWTRAKSQIRAVEGETLIAPGVRLVPLPGHTPGSQGVLVDCPGGRYLIAGDCVYTYENWEGDAEATHIPAGLYTDLIAFEESFRLIEALRAEVIPSHDMHVLERRTFQ